MRSEAWREVMALIEAKKPASYNKAVALLVRRRDLADYQGRLADFQMWVTDLRVRYANCSALCKRLQRAGLVLCLFRRKRGTRMGERILLVDDNPDVARFCAQSLSDEGFEVDIANQGRQALSLLKEKGGYDVLIVDFALPDVSGLDLLHSVERNIPIIFISGYLSKKEMETISHMEGLVVLMKPFSVTALVAAVKQVLQERRPG